LRLEMSNSGISGTKADHPMHMTDELYAYARLNGVRESDALRGLREETTKHPMARMMGAPDEAQLFQILLRLMGAKKVVEIGVFTGYTTLAIAEALPADGKVYGLDISEEFAAVGRPFWKAAGVESRIDLRIAPALDTLAELEARGERIDFAFMDADKVNYPKYYEVLLRLVRPGGLIAIDNVFWGGSIVDSSNNDETTTSIRQLNEIVRKDSRVDIVMLAIADGVTLARVR